MNNKISIFKFSLYCSLFLALQFCITGCAKDPVIPSYIENKTDVIVPLIPPVAVQLEDVTLQFKDGIPIYENTNSFLAALDVVNRSSPKRFEAWAQREKLTSLFHVYESLLDKMELQEDSKKPFHELLSEDERSIFMFEEGMAFLNYNFPCPKLTNESSELFIGNDLHYFGADVHIIIENGSKEDLLQVLTNPNDINFNKPTLISKYNLNVNTSKEEKIRNRIIDCPLDFANSDQTVLTTQTYFDYLCCGQDQDIPQYSYQGRLREFDEQHVGCNRKRCRQHTFGVIAARTLVTEIFGTHYSEATIVNYLIVNRKKNRRQKTWVDVSIEPQPFNPLMKLRVETSYFDADGNQRVTSLSSTSDVRIPRSDLEIQAFHGIHWGQWSLLTTARSIPYGHPNVRDVRSNVFIESGSIGHRWTNRGNDPVNDPIAVYFICI